MTATYELTAEEFNQEFFDSIKSTFKNGMLQITIEQIEEMDETEYLMSSEANKKMLLESIEYVKSGEPLISVPNEQIQRDAGEEY
jgi:antitoxin YefM